LKPKAELDVLLAPWLGDDPVFGRMREWQLAELFDEARMAGLRAEIGARSGPGCMSSNSLGRGGTGLPGLWSTTRRAR
jgi:hypothetical protein